MRARAAYGAAALVVAVMLAVAAPDREALARVAPWCALAAAIPPLVAGGRTGLAAAVAVLAFASAGAWYAVTLGPLAAAAHALALGALVWAMLPALAIAKTRLTAGLLGAAGAALLVLGAEPAVEAWTLDATLARSAAQALYGGAALALAVPVAARPRSRHMPLLVVLCTLAGLALAWFAAQKLGVVGWWAGFGLASLLLVAASLLKPRDTVRNDEAHAHSAR